MQKVIIADSSCLILLEKIGELALLHSVFGEIVVTREVADEFGEILPDHSVTLARRIFSGRPGITFG